MTHDVGGKKYDGQEWATIVAKDASPVCGSGYRDDGFFVDSQDRLWLW